LLPFIGTFEDVEVEVGVGVRVSSLFENPPLRGPLSHVWVFFFLVSFLFRIFVIVFASVPASASICPLSLSQYHRSMSLYISLPSKRVSPRMSQQ
jgi:hypothetical protein